VSGNSTTARQHAAWAPHGRDGGAARRPSTSGRPVAPVGSVLRGPDGRAARVRRRAARARVSALRHAGDADASTSEQARARAHDESHAALGCPRRRAEVSERFGTSTFMRWPWTAASRRSTRTRCASCPSSNCRAHTSWGVLDRLHRDLAEHLEDDGEPPDEGLAACVQLGLSRPPLRAVLTEQPHPAPMHVSAFGMQLHAAVTVDGRDRTRRRSPTTPRSAPLTDRLGSACPRSATSTSSAPGTCRLGSAMVVPMASARYQALVERVRAVDPDLVLAAGEVDHELVDWFASLTPPERLDRAARMASDLESLRHARRPR
jgi:hypothetical protein